MTLDQVTTLLLAALALGAYQAFMAWWFPEKRCSSSRCEGGKIFAPNRKSWRRHRGCDGKGYVLRFGSQWFR